MSSEEVVALFYKLREAVRLMPTAKLIGKDVPGAVVRQEVLQLVDEATEEVQHGGSVA